MMKNDKGTYISNHATYNAINFMAEFKIISIKKMKETNHNNNNKGICKVNYRFCYQETT